MIFDLKAFESKTPLLSVKAYLEWVGDCLHVRHEVDGAWQELHLGKKRFSKARQDFLWTQTCFEFFIQQQGEEYLEFNFSPMGSWQTYSFKDYRKLQNPPPGISCHRQFILRSVGFLHSAQIYGLKRLENQALNVAFIGHLKNTVQAPTHPLHWALDHGKKPDFHDKKLWKRL